MEYTYLIVKFYPCAKSADKIWVILKTACTSSITENRLKGYKLKVIFDWMNEWGKICKLRTFVG